MTDTVRGSMRLLTRNPASPALTLAAFLAIAFCGCGESRSKIVHPNHQFSSSPAKSQVHQLRSSFRLFRSRSEVAPRWLRIELHDIDETLDARYAQRVEPNATNRFWLIPKDDETCLFEIRGRGRVVFTCSPLAIARTQGFAIISIRPIVKNGKRSFKRRIFDVLPDWVRHVWVQTDNEKVEPAVHRGVINMTDWNYNPPDSIVTWPHPMMEVP